MRHAHACGVVGECVVCAHGLAAPRDDPKEDARPDALLAASLWELGPATGGTPHIGLRGLCFRARK